MASSVPNSSVSSKELLEAQYHLWNQMLNLMNSFALKTAIELGIPNSIHKHGKPMALIDLAAALSIPSFQRFMNLLVHNGLFTQTTSETNEIIIHYSLTTNSLFLVEKTGVAIVPVIEMILYPPMLEPWQHLTAWFKSETLPSTAFESCHGFHIWESAREKPELGRVLMDGMDSDSAAVAKVILEDCADQFVGAKTMVEVAGNTGKIALAIAEAFPEIKCKLLELPHVIDTLDHKSDKIEYVAGDMFQHIPPADVLILKWLLMTWDDESCVKILSKCREAIPVKENGGKVIIIDKVVDAAHADHLELRKRDETHIYGDVQVLVQFNGKQRREKEWKKLFDEAGFKEYNVLPALGMRCIIELYH